MILSAWRAVRRRRHPGDNGMVQSSRTLRYCSLRTMALPSSPPRVPRRWHICDCPYYSVGVLELAFGVGHKFVVGDSVVHALVHLYDPRIESISYDDAVDQDHLLKSSTITYTVKLQKLRRH